MKLRHKFGVLSLIYVVSLSANLAMSGWCILVYFQSVFVESQSTSARQSVIEWARVLARRQLEMLESGGDAAGYEELHQAMSAALSRLQDVPIDDDDQALLTSIREVVDQAHKSAVRLFDPAARSEPVQSALLDEAAGSFLQLDRLLGAVAESLSREYETAMQRTGVTTQRVVAILVANTVCGMLLCLAGIVLVRRWVLQPVEELRAATKELSQGHFEYRVGARSSDELGRLAQEVNHMAETIVQMQAKLVEQERLAAAGEMVTRLAHNIRNPLAGIRGLAEETLRFSGNRAAVADSQQRIIDSIDRFEKWLRDLQTSVSPLKVAPRSVCMGTLVANVCTALQPMAVRRKVRIEVSVAESMPGVEVDDVHFEHVLVALITNALQASSEGQVVYISVSPLPGSPARWRLSVRDEGAGVAEEIQDKIFLPYFTTKRGGNGVGLATASKVVRLHGGQLTVTSQPGYGARFDVDMPGLRADG